VVDASLRLLHPFIPFVTEEIWQKAGRPGSIMTAAWPEAGTRDEALEKRMTLVFDVVRAVRDVRMRNNIPPKTALDVVVSSRDAEVIKQGADIIRAQANVGELTIGADLPKPKMAATAAAEAFTVYVPLAGKIDMAAEVERTKKEIEAVKGQIAQAEKQLANEEFRKRKPELAAEIEEKLKGLKARLGELEAHLKDLA
jgi:valyl-tRNA synthetase